MGTNDEAIRIVLYPERLLPARVKLYRADENFVMTRKDAETLWPLLKEFADTGEVQGIEIKT